MHNNTAARAAKRRGVNQRTFREAQYSHCNILLSGLSRGDTSLRINRMPDDDSLGINSSEAEDVPPADKVAALNCYVIERPGLLRPRTRVAAG
jgi:hypothetical protein